MDENTNNNQNKIEQNQSAQDEIIPRKTSKRSKLNQNEKKAKTTPKKLKQSIKLDTVNPTDFLKYNYLHSCEHCSHWNSMNGLCSLGYKNDIHRLEANLKTYELNGKMAFCRFLEID